jgi:dimethylglycine dehydrogenase
VRDISDETIGFSLSGPKSRELLARVTHQGVSNEALPFMGTAALDVGLVRAKVARLSVTGELGYEINCRALEQASLRRTLIEAGRDLGIREYGYNALLSLRLEKSFGIWSAEFTQDRTPRMTGMDRWIAWDKGDFLGRKAALAESKRPPPERQLVTLEVDAVDADATGYEPVWRSGALVGFVTSGGYGHTLDKSLAMALIAPDASKIGSELSVHIVGVERNARVVAPSPYDPAGKAMRS